MKNLQMELNNLQTNKQARKVQLEPLQDIVVQIIVELEVEKTRMEQAHAKRKKSLK
jgi:hypothetical protein